ncbi:MAG: carbohydrate kinase family protein [Candidatus Babeliales bacterium]
MKKVLTVGGAMRDIFIQYKHIDTLHLHTKEADHAYVIMQEGRKIEVKHLAYYVGGGAANSAVSFARLGFDVTSFFKLGMDQEAKFILSTLRKEKVGTENVVYSKKESTGTSFIIPNKSGNRTVLVYRGANIMLTKKELPQQAISVCDQLYITSLSGLAARLLLPITVLAKKYNKSVATNPGTSQLMGEASLLKQALPNIDILILNSFEAQLLMASIITIPLSENVFSLKKKGAKKLPQLLREPMGSPTICFTLPQFFREMQKQGPRIIVVTNGSEGVYAAQNDTIFFHPSLLVRVVSTLGAGDAFGSCFVAQLMQDKPIEYAIRAGIVNSASVIQDLDTQTSLCNASSLQRKLKGLDSSLLQTFSLS